MKRSSEEGFNEYKERRKHSNISGKAAAIGKIIFSGGTYRKFPKIEAPRPVLVSPAVGKRHKGESLADFRKRRQICNTKRRIRDKDYGKLELLRNP